MNQMINLQHRSVLTADQFADSFQNNFIDSHDNKSLVDKFLQNHLNCNVSKNQSLLTVSDIINACRPMSLKASNCLDYNELTVKHILYAHPFVFIWLKKLFNSTLAHGYVPDSFGHSQWRF